MKKSLLLGVAIVLVAAAPSWAQLVIISALYPSQAPSSTVASLPGCTSSLQGVSFLVTDALTPVALSAVVAGGAVKVRVTCNGSNWIVG